ncbi:hypothetical protein BDV26DRAFT_290138 [Aspergillus bertholletiae]|uniref:Uncharacterized protein n=1 Tax=Aspergillus bertholletiae TaxID=1226010 RepID=A0A5N7BG20_9EURO|nr:hypothetical protein BDV26DRAFT_290138 [Aspergillus bertholletiae]
MRVGLSSEDERSIRRASSSGPAFKMVETQVDSSTERQEAQQARKKERRRLKKKQLKEDKKRKKAETKKGKAIDLPLESDKVDISNAHHPPSYDAVMSSQPIVDKAPPSHSGFTGGPLEEPNEDTSSSHTVRPSGQQREEHEEQSESLSICDETSPITCHLHVTAAVPLGGPVAAHITQGIAAIVSLLLGPFMSMNMPRRRHQMTFDRS